MKHSREHIASWSLSSNVDRCTLLLWLLLWW